jgi:hypothetical protein
MSTVERFREVVQERFGGRLSAGCHGPNDGAASAHEAAAAARGREWSDSSYVAGLPELRGLNDAPWPSDEARAEGLVPVIEALWDWESWSEERQRTWGESVALRVVRDILPDVVKAFGLKDHARNCARASTLADASAALRRTARALDRQPGPAARSARESADSAEQAASTRAQHKPKPAAEAVMLAAYAWSELGRPDAAEATLRTACRIWREAALSQ